MKSDARTPWPRPSAKTAKRGAVAAEPPPAGGRIGLGDIVHALAAPIAKLIDRVAGTDLQNCTGCAKRREEWNGRAAARHHQAS